MMTMHRAKRSHSLRVARGWLDVREGQCLPSDHAAVAANPDLFEATDGSVNAATTIIANQTPRPDTPKRTTSPPTPDPDALVAVRRATGVARTRFHEAAHAIVAALLDVPVGVIVVFGEGQGAETRHDEADPRRSAVTALASVAIGELGRWGDYLGPSGDIEVARAATRELNPDDAKASFERLEAEARALVADNLAAIVRLADVLEDFDGRLAGWQVNDALAYALQRPSPRPRPGPRGEAADILGRFWADRRRWMTYLQEQLDDRDDSEAQLSAFMEADRRAQRQEPPPLVTSSSPEPFDGPRPAPAPPASPVVAAASTSDE